MRTLALLGVLVLLAAVLTGCSSSPAVVRSQMPDTSQPAAGDLYYFDTCPQCGTMLGARGDAVERVYATRQVRFCEQACVEAFEGAFATSLGQLDRRMIEDQRAYYPLETCVVTGRPLGASAVEFVCRNRLIRVADRAARTQFEADPDAYWRTLNEAAIARHGPGYVVEKCPVQGTKLEGSPSYATTVVIANRIVRTCCRDCAKFVRSKPSHFVPLIDSAQRMLQHPKPS